MKVSTFAPLREGGIRFRDVGIGALGQRDLPKELVMILGNFELNFADLKKLHTFDFPNTRGV